MICVNFGMWFFRKQISLWVTAGKVIWLIPIVLSWRSKALRLTLPDKILHVTAVKGASFVCILFSFSFCWEALQGDSILEVMLGVELIFSPFIIVLACSSGFTLHLILPCQHSLGVNNILMQHFIRSTKFELWYSCILGSCSSTEL